MRLNKSISLFFWVFLFLFLFINAHAQQTQTVYVKDKATRTGTVTPPRGPIKFIKKDDAVKKKVKTDKSVNKKRYLSNNKKKKKLKPKTKLVIAEWGCPCYGNYKSKVKDKRNKMLKKHKKRLKK
jgi:hypothetical protein